jgi:predicted NAD/FAD-dependent oxidoreductase
MAGDSVIVVVGAGISGLVAGRRLAAARHPVVVLERESSAGGRVATRDLAGGRFDTGAQFFTVRSREFGRLADQWLASGVAYEWCRGFDQPPAAPDGYPRYAGRGGMVALARDLASTLDVRFGAAVTAIHPEGVVSLDDHTDLRSRAVVLTPPARQSIALLDRGGVALPASARAALEAVVIEPALAVLARLEHPSAVPPPGGVQLEDGAFSFVADNQMKRVSTVPAVTLHATGHLSRQHWGEPDAALLARLLQLGKPWLGQEPIAAELVRWPYARPVVLDSRRCLALDREWGPLIFAGDAFGEARIEGAARSGWAAAEVVLTRLG